MRAGTAAQFGFVGLVWALASCGSQIPPPVDTVSLNHGPFEIKAEGRRIPTGAFPNNSGDPFATMEVTGFRIGWQGQAVTITRGDTTINRFWRVVRLPDAPQPTLLASTTDFHLITEANGQLLTRSFGAPSTDIAECQWLDADHGQPTPPQLFGIEKVDVATGTELRGGRWLRLAAHTVLDVKTLRAFPVRPWIESGSGKPMQGLGGASVARVFSPDQTQFVTTGSGYDYERDGEHYEALLVIDIPSGNAYGLRAERKTTHYFEADDVTGEWLAHYYRWTRDVHGERLVPRPEAKPLPWLGRIRRPRERDPEYILRPVRQEIEPVMATFLTTTMGGRVVDDWIDPNRPRGNTFLLPGCAAPIAIYWSGYTLGVYTAAPSDRPRADCRDTVRSLGERFNAELSRGLHQDLFLDERAPDES
jgi:hypothetical protein